MSRDPAASRASCGTRREINLGRLRPDQLRDLRPRRLDTPLSFEPNLQALDRLPYSLQK
jgi:hypothetical protein